jgi:hypothetical protein
VGVTICDFELWPAPPQPGGPPVPMLSRWRMQEQNHEQGLASALRRGIAEVCELLTIPLDAERRAELGEGIVRGAHPTLMCIPRGGSKPAGNNPSTAKAQYLGAKPACLQSSLAVIRSSCLCRLTGIVCGPFV